MSEHLDAACRLYGAWLDHVNEVAAEEAIKREAADAHALIVEQTITNNAGAAGTNNGG